MVLSEKKILVIDDTQFMVTLIGKVLSDVGYQVVSALSGEEALEMINSEKPDLILCDVVMTGMSGYDVLDYLRHDFRYNLIPIIMLTGQTEEEDKLKGLEKGADDYIVKPFVQRELLARVYNTLIRLERSRGCNPLTGLRGNNDIESEIMERIESRKVFSVLYLDLNYFKPYNDVYGFSNGDIAIKLTADIITECTVGTGTATDFVGHVGGDDFVVICEKENAIPISEKIIEQFEIQKLSLYNDEHRDLGYIIAKDRNGLVMHFELIGLSIAIINSDTQQITSTLQLAEIAAFLKKKAKAKGKSAYAVFETGDNYHEKEN